jgi:Tat protein translocase TatB subunit
MPTSLGPAEIIVILVVALIVLGPKRLPEAGRQVGRALAEVRRWSQGFQREVRDVLDTEPVVESKPLVDATPPESLEPKPAASDPPADPSSN